MVFPSCRLARSCAVNTCPYTSAGTTGTWRSLKPSGVREYCGLPVFMSSLTKEENSSPLRLSMFSRKTGCPLRSASLSSGVSSTLQISFGMYISPFSGLWRVYCGRPVTLSSVTKEENSAPSVRFMSSTRMVCPSLSILIWLGESCTPPRLCWLNPLLSG